jgi:hypothetical protein
MPDVEMPNQIPGHHAIGLDAMLEAVELPTGVTKLDPSLTYVHTDNLSHFFILSRGKISELSNV